MPVWDSQAQRAISVSFRFQIREENINENLEIVASCSRAQAAQAESLLFSEKKNDPDFCPSNLRKISITAKLAEYLTPPPSSLFLLPFSSNFLYPTVTGKLCFFSSDSESKYVSIYTLVLVQLRSKQTAIIKENSAWRIFSGLDTPNREISIFTLSQTN